jgi:hypothetical protein
MAVSLGASRLFCLYWSERDFDDEYETSDELTVKLTGWIRPRVQLLRRATNGWLPVQSVRVGWLFVRLPDE